MSRENLDTVRRAVEAVNDRDLERYLTYCTEDIELWNPISALEGAFEGRDGVARFFARLETAPDFRLEIEHMEAVGPRRIVAFVRVAATARTTGIPIGSSLANVYDLAGGRIRRIRVFEDRDEGVAYARERP